MRLLLFLIGFLIPSFIFCQAPNFLDYVNKYRKANGSPPLKMDLKSSQQAREHNLILVNLDTCYHSKYGCGEIITRGSNLPMDSIHISNLNIFGQKFFGRKFICPKNEQEVIEMIYMQVIFNFHNSPPHKKNLLSNNYNLVGFDVDIRGIEFHEIQKHWVKMKCWCTVQYSCVVIFY